VHVTRQPASKTHEEDSTLIQKKTAESLYKPVCDKTESYELSSCKLMMNLQSDSAPCDSAKKEDIEGGRGGAAE